MKIRTDISIKRIADLFFESLIISVVLYPALVLFVWIIVDNINRYILVEPLIFDWLFYFRVAVGLAFIDWSHRSYLRYDKYLKRQKELKAIDCYAQEWDSFRVKLRKIGDAINATEEIFDGVTAGCSQHFSDKEKAGMIRIRVLRIQELAKGLAILAEDEAERLEKEPAKNSPIP